MKNKHINPVWPQTKWFYKSRQVKKRTGKTSMFPYVVQIFSSYYLIRNAGKSTKQISNGVVSKRVEVHVQASKCQVEALWFTPLPSHVILSARWHLALLDFPYPVFF